MDRQHDGRKPRADMAQLNAALTQLADSLMPTPGARRGAGARKMLSVPRRQLAGERVLPVRQQGAWPKTLPDACWRPRPRPHHAQRSAPRSSARLTPCARCCRRAGRARACTCLARWPTGFRCGTTTTSTCAWSWSTSRWTTRWVGGLQGCEAAAGRTHAWLPGSAADASRGRSSTWARALPRPACPPHHPTTLTTTRPRTTRRCAAPQAGKGEVAAAVGELMEAAGMGEVLPLPKARVPVVKFVVPATGTKVRAPWASGSSARGVPRRRAQRGAAGAGTRGAAAPARAALQPPPRPCSRRPVSPPPRPPTCARPGGRDREQPAGLREHQAAGRLLRHRWPPGPAGGPGQALGQAARRQRPVPRCGRLAGLLPLRVLLPGLLLPLPSPLPRCAHCGAAAQRAPRLRTPRRPGPPPCTLAPPPLTPCPPRRHALLLLLRPHVHLPAADAAAAGAAQAAAAAAQLPAHRGPVGLRVLRRRELRCGGARVRECGAGLASQAHVHRAEMWPGPHCPPAPPTCLPLPAPPLQVEALRGYGSANGECLGELLWAFFEYWAWRHNYSHDVVSVSAAAAGRQAGGSSGGVARAPPALPRLLGIRRELARPPAHPPALPATARCAWAAACTRTTRTGRGGWATSGTWCASRTRSR